MNSPPPDVKGSDDLPRDDLIGSGTSVMSRSSIIQKNANQRKHATGTSSKIRNPCFCCCCSCCNLRANCMAIGFIQIACAMLNVGFITEVPNYCKTADCSNENALINAEMIFLTAGWIASLASGVILLVAVFGRHPHCALSAGIFVLLTTLFGLLEIVVHVSLSYYINGRLSDLQQSRGDEAVAGIVLLLVLVFVQSGLNLWMASCCFVFRLQILAGLDHRAHIPPNICRLEDSHSSEVEDEAPTF